MKFEDLISIDAITRLCYLCERQKLVLALPKQKNKSI